nr:uncharacterized protein LOC111415608 [Onthophagus taurus]
MLRNVIYFLILIVSTKSTEKDVYWRDFKGNLPKDAIKAGISGSSPETYIGQAIYQGFLTPGTIYPKKKIFISEYFGKFELKEHIRILCSKNESKLSWERIHVDALPLRLEDRLIEGGYQGGIRWYIGRVFHQNEFRAGKVELYAHDYKGLFIWNDDGSSARFLEFEVLSYNN